jgi:hypothetical protein
MKKLIFLSTLLLVMTNAFGQSQTVKGRVADAVSESPIIGAAVVLVGSNPLKGAVTDVNGNFTISEVPVGRQTFAVQFIGYKTISIPNTLVTAGKEVVLNIMLEESVEQMKQVVVTAKADKDLPLNDLAKVSARTFSLEEVTRFSGGRNDVARLATSFAGVSAPDDSRNDIVVRGNSPVGLLWRIEGIPIATTNHFSTLGTTGGPVNALNTNLLRTSDFLTGAFPAEYGNANAAVFDVNFRNGNADKYEFTGQMSAYSGLEFLAEGPISKKNNSSFVASYRYGIASLAATGTNGTPYYQDFSFKVNLGESKLGKFELFGLGGLSNIDFFGEETDETDLFAETDQNAYVDNQLGISGLSHTLRLSKSAYIKSTLAASTNYSAYLQDNFILNNNDEVSDTYRAVNVSNRENRVSFTSNLNKKYNAQWSLRLGLLSEHFIVDFNVEDRDNNPDIPDENNDGIPDYFILATDINDTYQIHQLYGQTEYKLTDDFSVTAGLHSQYHSYTEAFALEPRAAASWQSNNVSRWSLAYGLHAQAVPSPILFYEERLSDDSYERTNSDLGFMKSHHFVLGYDRTLGSNWRLKAEAYYQSLFDIPVEGTASSYSVLNEGAGFVFENKGSLVNEGTGTNYGLELTLEKFFSKGYYLLLTNSLFESTYKGSDGIERNTAFNNNYVGNMLFGKEWKFGDDSRHALTFDTKFTTSGGKWFTPIDLEATRANGGNEVFMNQQAFSQQYDDYLRLDVKFGVRLNSKKRNVSHQFFVDLQNVTNRKNEFVRRYSENADEINSVYQIGFFPDVLYRIQF